MQKKKLQQAKKQINIQTSIKQTSAYQQRGTQLSSMTPNQTLPTEIYSKLMSTFTHNFTRQFTTKLHPAVT